MTGMVEAGRPKPALRTAHGVDGCCAGWFFVALGHSGNPRRSVVERVEELASGADAAEHPSVDACGLPLERVYAEAPHRGVLP